MADSLGAADLVAGAFQIVAALSAVTYQRYLDNRADVQPGVISNVLRPVLLLAFAGAAIGVGTAIFGPLVSGSSAENAEVVVAVTCLLLTIMHFRARSGFVSYLLEVSAIWLAFVIGWKLFSGNHNPDFQINATYRWATCAIVGSVLILAFRRAPAS
jgi:hypothetical protein